jgi:hypothetical protein
VVGARHLEQVRVEFLEVDELLALALNIGADELQAELIGQVLGVGRRFAAAVRVVLVDRHIRACVERVTELRRQVVVEPLAAEALELSRVSSAMILSFELSPHLIVRLARPENTSLFETSSPMEL